LDQDALQLNEIKVLKQEKPETLLIAACITALGLRIGNVEVRIDKLFVQSSDPGSTSRQLLFVKT
jgi:hypothetical protein